jgi:hypothetical protein
MSADEKEKNENEAPRDVQLFVQGEGSKQIRLISIDAGASVGDLVAELAAKFSGEFPMAVGDVAVMLEDDDREIPGSATLAEAGLTNRKRVHVHRCRKVRVSVNFNGNTINDDLPPSTTVRKIKKWADKEFEIDKIDATAHALQLCGGPDRPDEDAHVGTLTNNAACSVCFDLVPKQRVEGVSK